MIKIGFKVEIIYESTLKYNTRRVEGKLQKMFHNLPYGSCRLWKKPDMGAKNDKKIR